MTGAVVRTTVYQVWKAAVEARGLSIHTYADAENGPSAHDLYLPTYAMQADGESVGSFPGPADEGAVGVLFETPAEFYRWENEGDGPGICGTCGHVFGKEVR